MTDPSTLVDLEHGHINPQVYTDQSIFDAEMREIFGRTWLFLVHESQLKKRGDFFTTFMGLDPVLVTKQGDGSLKAMLNVCRHRGMRVCTLEQGNQKMFTCPYHGWSYSVDGSLGSVPFEEDFPDSFDRTKLGLREIRIESYRGLVFGNFDPDAPSLEDYLGDMKHYIDAHFARREGGTEVISGVHKWQIRANWKIPSEQFVSDMYHTFTLHLSPYQVLLTEQDSGEAPESHLTREAAVVGAQFVSPYGHGSGWWVASEDQPGDLTISSKTVRDYLGDTHDEAVSRLGEARAGMQAHCTVFPNFSFLATPTATMRVWHPKEPGLIEVWSWGFVDAAAPAEVKDEIRRFESLTFGPGGIFEQDDGEVWVRIQNNLQGPQAQALGVTLQLGRQNQRPPGTDGLPGALNNVNSEAAGRSFFGQWLNLLQGGRWDARADGFIENHTGQVTP